MCDKYSAKEQNLGFLYQSRLALIEMLNLNEDVGLYVERRDDLEYVEGNDQFTIDTGRKIKIDENRFK